MKKSTKIIIGICAVIRICAVIIVVQIVSAVLCYMYMSGAFNKLKVADVASFESPDSEYIVIYQQLGDPRWPFGGTEVRLTLKNINGNKLNSVDTEIYDDGGNAGKGNIESIEWKSDSVVIVLRASEMPDKTVELKYKK